MKFEFGVWGLKTWLWCGSLCKIFPVCKKNVIEQELEGGWQGWQVSEHLGHIYQDQWDHSVTGKRRRVSDWIFGLYFRYSIGWSRVLPELVGEKNQAGIDYYNNLITSLLAAGINPAVTLYHCTGTCPRPWRTRAAGWAARWRTGLRSTPGCASQSSGTESSSGSRSMNARSRYKLISLKWWQCGPLLAGADAQRGRGPGLHRAEAGALCLWGHWHCG